MKRSTKTDLSEPTDFGDRHFPAALVNVTNVCNLECTHCFVFRDDNPNSPRDKMKDAVMLHQLEVLRDKHDIKSMLYMGGEPMIRKDLVFEAMKLFDHNTIVTNGTYGIPSVPGNLVSVSLDGPPELNDPIRGEGVFEKVRAAVHGRDTVDGTVVMLQMAITRENASGIEAFVETVKDWPISGVAFTFYVPPKDDASGQSWTDLKERDLVVDRVLALKDKYPLLIKANRGALELMKSEVCLDYTGVDGENCLMRNMLPLYMGDGGVLNAPFVVTAMTWIVRGAGPMRFSMPLTRNKGVARNLAMLIDPPPSTCNIGCEPMKWVFDNKTNKTSKVETPNG